MYWTTFHLQVVNVEPMLKFIMLYVRHLEDCSWKHLASGDFHYCWYFISQIS